MLDLPVPDNNSIIIFSATGGGSNEGGRLRQNIGFSSLTALTLSGGIENDFVRVTPSGSSFEVAAKFHKAQGSATFSVTATRRAISNRRRSVSPSVCWSSASIFRT